MEQKIEKEEEVKEKETHLDNKKQINPELKKELIERNVKLLIIIVDKNLNDDEYVKKISKKINTRTLSWSVMFCESHYPTCELCGAQWSENQQHQQKETLTLLKCSGCRVVSYCSKDHQKRDWISITKFRCELCGTEYPKILPFCLSCYEISGKKISVKEYKNPHPHKLFCAYYKELNDDKTSFLKKQTGIILKSLNDFTVTGVPVRFPRRFIVFTSIDVINDHELLEILDTGCCGGDKREKKKKTPDDNERTRLVNELYEIARIMCGIPTIVVLHSCKTNHTVYFVPQIPLLDCEHNLRKFSPFGQMSELEKLNVRLHQLELLQKEIEEEKKEVKRQFNRLVVVEGKKE